jgi:hypothetical protein
MEPQTHTGTSSMKRKAPLCNTLQREAYAKISTCYETVCDRCETCHRWDKKLKAE